MTSAFKNVIKKLASNRWFMPGLLLGISILISMQSILLGVHHFWAGNYTFYNNFVIFKFSFRHLIENKNLYEHYPNQYADLYKYSPTFALIMCFFYYLPDSIGLVLWNSVNIFVLYYAISLLKSIDASKKIFIVLFLLPELILSTGNSQSNALIAGLTILSFNLFEKGKNSYAIFFILLGAFIKIYSITGLILFLLYPNKLKSLLGILFWTIALFLVPLIVVDFGDLISQYKNWYQLLKADEGQSIGMSLFLYTQFILPLNDYKLLTLLFGGLILITPLFRHKQYSHELFRIRYLSFILVWMVAFNHKSESPTFVIAMSGIGIWFFSSKQSPISTALVILTFIFTSIWFTDLIPDALKTYFIRLEYIKSFFPVLVLFAIYYGLLLKKTKLKHST